MLNKFLKHLNRDKLIGVVSINSLSISIRLISGFAISKFMAIFIGPAGMAISGNLSNFMQSVESLSSLGVKNGVIKYVAESRGDKNQFKNIISSAFLIILSIALLLSSMLFLFSDSISELVFNNLKYSFLFKVSALMTPLFSMHIFFIAIINGLQKIKDLVQVNIIGYVASAILIVLLMSRNQLDGALFAIVITPLLLFFLLFLKYSLVKEIVQNINFSSISIEFLKKIGSFFSMTLFSGIMVPFIFLLIRNYIIDNIGEREAGYWEAVRKISNYYMLFVYTLFGIYLLPMLSEAKTDSKFRYIVFNFYKSILPPFIIGFLLIYVFRVILIKIVLTDDFLAAQQLFFWQLVGDFFKIVALTISYQFLAKKMIRLYIICETLYMAFIYFSSICLVDCFGLVGVVKAHAFSYVFYTLLMVFVFKNRLFKYNVVR